jgi:hypothetical protein
VTAASIAVKSVKRLEQKPTVDVDMSNAEPRLDGGCPKYGGNHAIRKQNSRGTFTGKKLYEYANRGDVIVLALPRGGVPVAYEVAKSLNAPLECFRFASLGRFES